MWPPSICLASRRVAPADSGNANRKYSKVVVIDGKKREEDHVSVSWMDGQHHGQWDGRMGRWGKHADGLTHKQGPIKTKRDENTGVVTKQDVDLGRKRAKASDWEAHSLGPGDEFPWTFSDYKHASGSKCYQDRPDTGLKNEVPIRIRVHWMELHNVDTVQQSFDARLWIQFTVSPYLRTYIVATSP